jgi:hypothetical protein
VTRDQALAQAKGVYLSWLSEEYDAGAVLINDGKPTAEARLIERIADALMAVSS